MPLVTKIFVFLTGIYKIYISEGNKTGRYYQSNRVNTDIINQWGLSFFFLSFSNWLLRRGIILLFLWQRGASLYILSIKLHGGIKKKKRRSQYQRFSLRYKRRMKRGRRIYNKWRDVDHWIFYYDACRKYDAHCINY